MDKFDVIKGYEVVRLTYAETLSEVKRNSEKLHDRELVVVATPPKLLIKIDGSFYSANLTKEEL